MPAFSPAPNEQIILIARRHWFFLAISLLKAAAFSLIPWVVAFGLAFFNLSAANEQAFSALFWYFALLFWFLCFCWAVLIWLDWYLDIWVVTNQRIIDIEQRRLFNRRILVCGLDKIQNVTAKTNGLLATFFKYGDVEIKTADETNQIIFQQVPSPNAVQDKILQAHQNYLTNLEKRMQS